MTAGAQVIPLVNESGKRVFVNAEPPPIPRVAAKPALGRATRTPDPVQPVLTTEPFNALPHSREDLQRMAADAADQQQVDPALVNAMITHESGWNPRAVSRKGAQGLMQLMPDRARLLGVRNVFDPAENLNAGVRHLRQLLDRFNGDLDRSLAAYNAGAGAVDRAGGVPNFAETRAYVAKITEAYFRPGSGRRPEFFYTAPRIYRQRDERGRLVFTNE